MTELCEKSVQILELPQVLRLLAAEAVSEEAKERAAALRPSDDPEEVGRRLRETSAACAMMTVKGTPSFRGIRPVASSLQRAEMGGMLNTRELLDIASVLTASRSVKAYGSADRNGKSTIDFLFESLQTNRFLEDKITGCIVGEDEIADAASPELASIRRHMRAASARVRENLQKIISSPHYAKFLQEPMITMRSDRYVVPVKSEHKGEVPGLVHDVSGSGSTFFIEPMSVVQANNELRELAAKEKKEIERILMELSADAAGHREGILQDYTLLIKLDGIFARGKLSFRLKASEPALKQDGSLLFRHARHPLLDPLSAVPIDVRLGSDFYTLVITGPNTGGKTVTLKTIGLLTLMAQCGLHIPVDDGSHISVFSKVLADIGDEQSIEQSLSTFSSHMKNIVRILDEADENTLTLFDELGAGTDPVEGAALAIAIIEETRKRGARIAATTHYAELKVYAMMTADVENASCEFDVETLRPTYKLLIGIPGKSNAFAISERLGLPEPVIARAKEQITGEDLHFEDVLAQLEKSRQEMERKKEETARLRLETEEHTKAANTTRQRLEQEREKMKEQARAEARQIVEDAREKADQVFRELDELAKQSAAEPDFQAANEARVAIRKKLKHAQAEADFPDAEEMAPQNRRPIKKGDVVDLLSMKTKATVLTVSDDGTLQLQAGILNVSAKPNEVRLLEGETSAGADVIRRQSERKLRAMGASPELDLRGMMTDEAVSALDRFLDDAMLANLQQVTIIHGKGTGALRAAVHQQLKNTRSVKSFRLGRYGEGEAGVTIAELK